MTTATEPTTEEAFWVAIGAAPEDQLPRLVFADWLEERAKVVEYKRCGGNGKLRSGMWLTHWSGCPTCKGEQYIPDRNGRMAAALRATADAVPFLNVNDTWTTAWSMVNFNQQIWRRVQPDNDRLTQTHPTAAAAIRDLCEAWCKVTYGEVGE